VRTPLLIAAIVGMHLVILFATYAVGASSTVNIEPEIIENSFTEKLMSAPANDRKKHSEKIMAKTVESAVKKIVKDAVKEAKGINHTHSHTRAKKICKLGGFLVSGIVPVFLSYRYRQELYGITSSIGSWMATYISLKNWLGIMQMRAILDQHTQQLEGLFLGEEQLGQGHSSILESLTQHDQRIRNGQLELRQLIERNHADIQARLAEIRARLDKLATKEDMQQLDGEVAELKNELSSCLEALASIEPQLQILLTTLGLGEQSSSQLVTQRPVT